MNRIKILREELNLTQQELADKLDGAKSSIAMYENGKRKPSLEILIKLSEIFECSIDYILCKTDSRNPEKIDTDKINIGLSTKDYVPPTPEQQEAIEAFAKLILKENKKDDKNGTK